MSLFTASPASSRAAQQILKDLFSMEPIPLSHGEDDELDQVLKVPMMNRRWDSVASKCLPSGAVLHFLSLSTYGRDTVLASENETVGHLSLLGVTDSVDDKQNDVSAVKELRRLLASHMNDETNRYVQSLRLVMKHAAGRFMNASDITRLDSELPLLSLPMNAHEESLQSKENRQGWLKEIVIPFYDDSAYPNGQSLLSMLGSSTLNRPAVGLYQWPKNGIAIRPIPSAKEDRTLPAPSLVFYCEDLDQAADRVSRFGAVSGKIGYNGLEKHGQLMISHPSLPGLDIRLTGCVEYTSAFPEAQEALLASSLGELQNVNVIVEGGKDASARTKVDDRVNNGDCWVEFRANMKRPSGFMKRAVKSKVGVKTAKAPDLPYE